MRKVYAVRSGGACCGGGIVATFEIREDAEAHAHNLGTLYEVVEVPFYPQGIEPQKTSWWRAGGQVGTRSAPAEYEYHCWDWDPQGPPAESEDGVLQGGTNSKRFPYYFAVSYTKGRALAEVKDAIEGYSVPV